MKRGRGVSTLKITKTDDCGIDVEFGAKNSVFKVSNRQGQGVILAHIKKAIGGRSVRYPS
jgi:hypothetical protein